MATETVIPNTTNTTLTVEEQIKRANGQSGEASRLSPDEYIDKRREEKREKRGGVKVRIDKLTKEAAEQKRLAEEMKQKLDAVQKQTEKPAVTAPVTPTAAADANKPDPRPKREDFQDEASHTQAIAEWVVRQQNRLTAKPVTEPEKKPEIKYDPANPEHVAFKGEFDGFIQTGQDYVKAHPDFNDRLNAAAAKGLTIDNMAQRAIIKLKAPQVLYYLADPANEAQARALMAMDAVNQVVQIGLIHDRLQAKASDYVSNAPAPGPHLTTGNSRANIPRDKMDTDDYIALRREEKRSRFRH